MSLPAFRHTAPTHRHRQRLALDSQSLMVMFCSMFLIFGGCTTTQTVDLQSKAVTQDDPKPGDAVVVSLRNGRKLELTVVEWTAEQLVGTDQSGSRHTIAREDITQLEATRISGGKATTLVVAFAIIALSVMIVNAYAQSWAPPIL
ncbi:MAG: hypothetical protein WD795_20140 [Woeseia sp.]